MTVLAKRNFAAGEAAPGTPVDFKAFLNGVKTLTNWRVMRMGGIENSPGTIYVTSVKDPTRTVRALGFIFNSSTSYLIEMGDFYMRFFSLGTAVVPIGATAYDATKTYAIGDLVGGGSDYYYCIAATTGNAPPNATYWYHMTNTAYEIPTPYAHADISEIRFAQTADVMTITHPSYAPRQLKRYASTKWILSTIPFNPLTQGPINGTLGSQNEIQTMGAGYWTDGTPIQGTINFIWNGTGVETGALAWNASNATIQAAMDLMVGGDGSGSKLTVTNQFIGVNPMILTYHGTLAGQALPLPTVKASSLSRTGLLPTFPTITEIQKGSPTSGLAGTNTYQYKVTALNKSTKEESLPGYGPLNGFTISALAVLPNGTVQVTTGSVHGLLDGDEVLLKNMTAAGVPELDNQRILINYLSTTSFYLRDTDGTNFGAWTAGGTVYSTQLTAVNKAVPTAANPIKVTPGTVDSSIASINIYKKNSMGIYGFVANIPPGQTWNDTNVPADTTLQPPKYTNLFSSTDNYPSVCCYYQQRLILGATNNEPIKIWGSRISYYNNFTVGDPILESDSYVKELSGFGRVSKIQHLIASRSLVVLTSEGEMNVNGFITPNGGTVSYDSNFGSSSVPPFLVGQNIIFQQRAGSILRDQQFSWEGQGFSGNDLTIFSSHLVDGHTFSDMSYQYNAQSIINQIRDDGVKLNLTYLKEQEVLGWARRTTDGSFENTVVIPEGSLDVEYQVVKRSILGLTKRYIEYTSNRNFTDLEDAYIMDAARQAYDGRRENAITWYYDPNTLRIISSTDFFDVSNVGQHIRLGTIGDKWQDFVITAFISITQVTVTLASRQDDLADFSNLGNATSEYALLTTVITGLDHLEGKAVSIWADKMVLASPNNSTYPTITVNGGNITLPISCAVVNVGLPYMSDVETFNIDFATSETLADKRKAINRVGLMVDATRGLWAGAQAPEDVDGNDPDSANYDPLLDLDMLPDINIEDNSVPIELVTDFLNIPIRPEWNSNGRVFIRQVDPAPARITAIFPGGKVFGK